eukprot:2646336-Amphidinium_carterae.1
MRSVAPSRPRRPRWLGRVVRPGRRALLGEPADWVSWFRGTFSRPGSSSCTSPRRRPRLVGPPRTLHRIG